MIDSSKIDEYWNTVEDDPVDPLPESRILNPRFDDEDIFFFTKLQISITVTGILASEELI